LFNFVNTFPLDTGSAAKEVVLIPVTIIAAKVNDNNFLIINFPQFVLILIC
jgi:hypothetical protein